MLMKSTDINAGTGCYCIFGNPVSHSVSPLMHNAAFRASGINAVYLAFEPGSIAEAVASMKSLGIKGASVTIPFKIDALSCCDEVDPIAADIGSVNTLVNSGGRIRGFNTDGYGAARALEESKVALKGAACLVIGNGGSARAIAFTLIERGASVIIAGRNAGRIGRLAGDLRARDPGTRSMLLENIDGGAMKSVDVIINTTPVGMTPDVGSMPLDISLLSARHAVFDIVYAPHMTRLLTAARERGSRIVHGIDMLVYQGARQFELWTGKPAPVKIMMRAARRHIQRTK
jgi:shikimate dehydrogenase